MLFYVKTILRLLHLQIQLYEQIGDAMFPSSLTRLTYVVNINYISNADKINGDLHSTLNFAQRYFIMSELD